MNNQIKVAVIGSGISGLTAAYILQKKYAVTLYEADKRLGGHTHTHIVTDSNSNKHTVDSGFIVHNPHTYPLLLKLFKELKIVTKPTEMSLSISCRGCDLEFAGSKGISGLFVSPLNIFKLNYIRLLLTINKFNNNATKLLQSSGDETITLGEFMKAGKYGSYFETHYLLPTVSSIWSCEFDQARKYPAKYLFQFFKNHGMLQASVGNNNDWRVVQGGSSTYIQKIIPLLHKVIYAAATKLERKNNNLIIIDSNNTMSEFDKVVIATHPDQALRLLAKPTTLERQILSAFRYTDTLTLLHTDTSVLPKNEKAAASWNYLIPECKNSGSTVRISYDMNRLQHINSSERYIVSLDSKKYIDPKKVLATMRYQHPLFTQESVAAQKKLPALNTPQIAFAGAYHGWGFHEDGCRSGVAAAAALGVKW